MNRQVIASLTQKGQMTLPKAARETLGVKPGDDVMVEVDDNAVRIKRARTITEIRNLTTASKVWPGDAAADRIVAEGVGREYRSRHSSSRR